MQAGAWRDVEERERQELTQTGVHEQGSSRDPRGYETWKGSALVFASRMGKTGMVEKLLAAGAKAERRLMRYTGGEGVDAICVCGEMR